MSKALRVAVIGLALLPSAYVAWTGRDMPHLGLFHDDSLYWVCAKSLAEGSGYRILSLPEQPYQTKYPPLYPLLLAGIWKLNPNFPENLPLATLFAWISLPLCLLLCERVFADLGLGQSQSLVATVLLALNPYVILYSVSLESEVPFLCLLLGSFLLARRAERPGAPRWGAAVAGGLAGLAFLMRTAALPLLAAMPLYYLWRRRKREAALFFGAMLPAVAAWNLWVRGHLLRTADPILLYYTDYLGYHLASFTWADLPLLVWKNVLGTVEGLGGLFPVFVEGVPAGIVGVVAIAGLVGLARRNGLHAYHVYAGGYLLMLMGWHLGLSSRYLRLVLPLAPLVAAGLMAVISSAGAAARRCMRSASAWRVAAAPVLGTVLGLGCALGAANTLAILARFPELAEDSRETLRQDQSAFRWIQENLPGDATFLASQDPVLYLYTRRRGLRFILPPGPLYREDSGELARLYREVAGYARQRGLGYVFARGSEGKEQVGEQLGDYARLAANPELEVVFRSPGAAVYRVKEPAGESAVRR